MRQTAPLAPIPDRLSKIVHIAADNFNVSEVQAAQEPIEDFIADTAVMRGQDSELHGLPLSIVLNLLNAF